MTVGTECAGDPRLLLIDMTPISGSAATSTLKHAYFSDWREDALLQIQEGPNALLAISSGLEPARAFRPDAAKAVALVAAFRPQVILYRPVPEPPALHRFAMDVLEACDAPFALWMMDDWPERLRESDPARFEAMDADLRALMARSSANFAISDGMASAFGARYGVAFDVAHNGVIAHEWPARARAREEQTTVRYAGSLAPDTTKDSVLLVAEAVSRLARKGLPVAFEGRTQAYWHSLYGKAFNRLASVSMRPADMSTEAYRQWLTDADIVLIAYNFDETTRRYLQYSFANKMPEAFASGAAILALGPKTLETIAYLRASNAAEVVDSGDPAIVEAAIARLIGDPERRAALGEAGRALAFSAFDLGALAGAMKGALRRIASKAPVFGAEAARGAKVQLDECRLVFEVLRAKSRPGVMIDVGAHHGSSLKPFAQAGWRVYAFEPDKKNREALEAAFGRNATVKISDKAVGAREASGVAFFSSDVSSGISSLSAFHESHVPAAQVDVTTLDKVVGEEQLAAVDFLKIDVEGHEMDVLDGIDLSAMKPRVIVAEFEDGKTRAQGVGMPDLAGRFLAAGYRVYVSEWWPVEQYGQTHSWRRLQAFPCETGPDAWGNLIAFLDPPGEEALEAAAAAAMKGGPSGLGANAGVEAVAGPAQPASLYRKAATWLVRRHPRIADVLRRPARLVLKVVRGARV